jgi:hypothetical protein
VSRSGTLRPENAGGSRKADAAIIAVAAGHVVTGTGDKYGLGWPKRRESPLFGHHHPENGLPSFSSLETHESGVNGSSDFTSRKKI